MLPALIEVDQTLAEFAARLGGARARLAAAVALADAGGLLVDRTGAVHPDPARPRTAAPVGPGWSRWRRPSAKRWPWPGPPTGRRSAGWPNWRRRPAPDG
ncbi:hypothetical protein MRQ36_08995 [Micromonospora sp. R77]|uniref:hypothetical protein n=1 Tax=Micromonospora sp. R77 TaxID=2925836 RepID=UPI001F605070|nr:hypothetical protein [Micromonospora sp. R77]MCI4062700.1 hypothetical protein [Micromonospora sp. R77]